MTAFPSHTELAETYGVSVEIIEAALVRYAKRRIDHYFAKAFQMDVYMAESDAVQLMPHQIEANERLFRECRTDGALR